MKKLKSARVFLAVLLMLTMTACSTGDTGSSSESNSENNTESSTAENSAKATESSKTDSPDTPASTDSITLECFLIKIEALNVMEQIGKKFTEEYPNAIVNFVATADAQTAFFARVASNEVPDIMNTYPAEVVYRNMMEDGLFVDLTDHEMLNNVSEYTLALSEYKGRQYALPVAMNSYGVYYNKDIFEENGVTVPTNYEEFIQVCKTLQEKGVQPIVFGDKSAGGVGQQAERLTGILNNESNELFQRVANGETDLTVEPEIRAVAETMLEIRQYGQADQLGTDHDQAIADFVAEKAAMFISGTWVTAPMLEINKDLNFSMFQFFNPMGTGESVPVNIDTSYSVYTDAADVEMAVNFLEFNSRTEIAQLYADVEGSPNVIKGVQYNIEQLKNIDETIKTGDIFLTPINFWPSGMRSAWEPHLQQLFIDKDVDAFVQETQSLIEEFYNEQLC